MKQNLKYYNFYNFELKQKQSLIEKSDLSVSAHYNLTAYSPTIKPVFGFENFLLKIFGSQKFNILFEKYPEYKNKFVYVRTYQYFSQSNEKCSIYFAISNDLELFLIDLNDYTITSLEISFNKFPQVFENNQKLYFFSQNDVFLYFERNNSPVFVSNFINIETYLDFQDKTYFVVSENPYKIFVSEKVDFENIDESTSFYESITVSENDGKILALLNFKGNLFVVQQFAISKLMGNLSNYYF